MPGSLLPAALSDPGNNRVVAVRVASHPLPTAGGNWLEGRRRGPGDRLQSAPCHHGKDESGSSQERVGQGCEPAGVEWVAGGLQ